MAAFHNRARELATLDQVQRSGRAELMIVYGRRGVGKSTLLSHSLAGTRHIYYRATRRTLPLQLETLTAMVRDAYPDVFLADPLRSLDAFLRFLEHQAQARPTEPVIAVLDELPYLADVDAGFLTLLQHWWDDNKRHPNLKLFLAGSYVAFMQEQVLDVNAPLYNRRSGALRLEPFDYAEASLFFPDYTPRERIEAYAVLGGMPSYLEQFDPALSIDDNLLRTALRPNTYLNEEPDWLLLEDLRKDVTAGSILRAIATGQRRPGDIARAIGKQSAQDISVQLQRLVNLTLVRRDVPITERHLPSSRNSLYVLADNYLAFWYRYVDQNRSLIAQGLERRVLDRIRQTFTAFVSRPAFEEVCRQALWRAFAAGTLPSTLAFDEGGTWWSGSSEIDVVARDQGETTLVGSCKWTNSPMGIADLLALQQALQAHDDDLHPAVACWYALFSREGFTADLMALARQPDQRVLLFTPAELYPIPTALPTGLSRGGANGLSP